MMGQMKTLGQSVRNVLGLTRVMADAMVATVTTLHNCPIICPVIPSYFSQTVYECSLHAFVYVRNDMVTKNLRNK